MAVVRRLWWVPLGLALLVLGLALVASGSPPRLPPTDFGWYAYTPLGGGSDLLLVTRTQAAGYAVAGLALLVLVAGASYRLGARARVAA